MGFRISQSPFADGDDTNLDIYPLFFYENGDFYLDGLDIESPGDGVNFTFGIDARLHLFSNLYLLGDATLTVLDSGARDVSFVDRSTTGTLFAGVGLFDDEQKPPAPRLKSRPYLRLAHGWPRNRPRAKS